VTVGKHTYGAEYVRIDWPQAEVSIGAFCSIASPVSVMAGGNHHTDRGTTFPFGHRAQEVFPFPMDDQPTTRGPVRIGNDVWIGAHASIMSGVTIGDGAVIAAYAHVASNVKPYAVVGGNPAEVLFFRHPPDVVRQLLALRWWDLPDDVIAGIVPWLMGKDLTPLFAWWKERNA
jgi:hypothetical protein